MMTKGLKNYLKNSSFFAATLFNNHCMNMDDYLYSGLIGDEYRFIDYSPNYSESIDTTKKCTIKKCTIKKCAKKEFTNGNLKAYNLFLFHKATKGYFKNFSQEELKEINFDIYCSYYKFINSFVKVHVASVPTKYIIKVCSDEFYNYYIALIDKSISHREEYIERYSKDIEEYTKNLKLIKNEKIEYELEFKNTEDLNKKSLIKKKYIKNCDLEKKYKNIIEKFKISADKYSSEIYDLNNLKKYISENKNNLDFQDIHNKIKDYIKGIYEEYVGSISDIVNKKFKFTGYNKFYIDSDITKIDFLEDDSVNLKNNEDKAFLKYTHNNKKAHYNFDTRENEENKKYLCQSAELDVLLGDKESIYEAFNAIKSLIENEPLFYVKISQKVNNNGVRNNKDIFTLYVYNFLDKYNISGTRPKYYCINNAFLRGIKLYRIESKNINDIYSDYFSNFSGLFENIETLYKVDLSDYEFKNPVSCYKSFSGCKNLYSVWLSPYMIINEAASMFSGCENLKSIYLWGAKFKKIKDYSNMFANCQSLESITFLRKMDFYNAENLSGFCENCRNLKEVEGISSYHTTNIDRMFFGCESLVEIRDVNFCGCLKNTVNNRKISAKDTFTGCNNLCKNNNEDILNINDKLRFFEGIYNEYSTFIVDKGTLKELSELVSLNNANYDKYLNNPKMDIRDNNGEIILVGRLYNYQLEKRIKNGLLKISN